MKFNPIFKIGDYISPVKKSIFCELSGIGLIISVNKYTYTVKTKDEIIYVHIQYQELYHSIIPNKREEIRYDRKRNNACNKCL
jgi:hypothetical protein